MKKSSLWKFWVFDISWINLLQVWWIMSATQLLEWWQQLKLTQQPCMNWKRNNQARQQRLIGMRRTHSKTLTWLGSNKINWLSPSDRLITSFISSLMGLAYWLGWMGDISLILLYHNMIWSMIYRTTNQPEKPQWGLNQIYQAREQSNLFEPCRWKPSLKNSGRTIHTTPRSPNRLSYHARHSSS